MRVAVMGSGGLGGYVDALLAKGGADVSFIARGAHLEAMRRDGLRIDGDPDPFHLEHVRATDDPAEIVSVDLVMVCVKLWDTEAALQQLGLSSCLTRAAATVDRRRVRWAAIDSCRGV